MRKAKCRVQDEKIISLVPRIVCRVIRIILYARDSDLVSKKKLRVNAYQGKHLINFHVSTSNWILPCEKVPNLLITGKMNGFGNGISVSKDRNVSFSAQRISIPTPALCGRQ